MSYSEVVTADIRLRLLQLLVAAAEYTQPEAALGAALGEQYGHRLSADRLTEELFWLDSRGMVSRLPVGRTSIVALSARGMDVAAGRTQVPGVARPVPGEL